MALSRAPAHRTPIPPASFHEGPVRGRSFSDAEHLPSWPELEVRLASNLCRLLRSRMFPRAQPTHTCSPSPCSTAPTTRCRFLLARHSLGPRTLGRESAWRQGTSTRRLPLPYSSQNLHPCSGRPRWLLGSHPHRSGARFVHANPRCFGRTAGRVEGYSPTATHARSLPLTSLSPSLRWTLASQPSVQRVVSRGYLPRGAVMRATRRLAQDAFHRPPRERLPPKEATDPMDRSVSRADRAEVRLDVPSAAPFCDAGLVLTEVRARCSPRASPCLRRSHSANRAGATLQRGGSFRFGFCRTVWTHGHTRFELSIPLRVGLPPRSAFAPRDSACAGPNDAPRGLTRRSALEREAMPSAAPPRPISRPSLSRGSTHGADVPKLIERL